MSEWSKEPVLKTGDGSAVRGFESHSLLQNKKTPKWCFFVWYKRDSNPERAFCVNKSCLWQVFSKKRASESEAKSGGGADSIPLSPPNKETPKWCFFVSSQHIKKGVCKTLRFTYPVIYLILSS